MEITPISGIAQTTVSKQTVEKIYKTGDGQHKVEKTIYYVTTYDSNGILHTVTNSHRINEVI
jgi:hypothetical protein